VFNAARNRPTFYVYRRGYNAANNPMRRGGPETMEVATVHAMTEEEALKIATDDLGITVFNNQTLYATKIRRPKIMT
jgi:hypothetical protein